MLSEIPKFPTDIEGFGYKFDENGELRKIDTSNYYLRIMIIKMREYITGSHS